MALKYIPTKLEPDVIDCLKEDADKHIFNSRNDGVNQILFRHYKKRIEEKRSKKKTPKKK